MLHNVSKNNSVFHLTVPETNTLDHVTKKSNRTGTGQIHRNEEGKESNRTGTGKIHRNEEGKESNRTGTGQIHKNEEGKESDRTGMEPVRNEEGKRTDRTGMETRRNEEGQKTNRTGMDQTRKNEEGQKTPQTTPEEDTIDVYKEILKETHRQQYGTENISLHEFINLVDSNGNHGRKLCSIEMPQIKSRS